MSPSWPVEVVPLNPVSCASALWRMDGFLRVTIVVKATFGLVPDGPARMIAPEAIVSRDRHHDKNPVASVEATGEIAPYLPKAGVVLVGHAYGPSGQAVPAMSARLCIVRERALIDKTVHVFEVRRSAPTRSGRAPSRAARCRTSSIPAILAAPPASVPSRRRGRRGDRCSIPRRARASRRRSPISDRASRLATSSPPRPISSSTRSRATSGSSSMASIRRSRA